MPTRLAKDRYPLLVLEAPNFGFGPVSSMLAVYAELHAEFDCMFVSTGAALRLVQVSYPHAEVLDLDTFSPASWDRVLDLIPRDALLVCNTNPHLAARAIERGRRTAVVDTLYWMWDRLPSKVSEVDLYAAQWYFGASARTKEESEGSGNQEPLWTRPSDSSIDLHQAPTPSGLGRTALVSFGGMGMPLDDELPLAYARWVLEVLLPVIFETGAVDHVSLFGGHEQLLRALPQDYRFDSRIDVVGFLPQAQYLERLRHSAFRFVCPGLATLYECASLGIRPLLLPAYNMSMVLQALDYANIGIANHGTLAAWSWAGTLGGDLRTLPEDQGVALVSRHVRDSLAAGHSGAEAKRLASYVRDHIHYRDSNAPEMEAPVIESWIPSGLPTAGQALRAALRGDRLA